MEVCWYSTWVRKKVFRNIGQATRQQISGWLTIIAVHEYCSCNTHFPQSQNHAISRARWNSKPQSPYSLLFHYGSIKGQAELEIHRCSWCCSLKGKPSQIQGLHRHCIAWSHGSRQDPKNGVWAFGEGLPGSARWTSASSQACHLPGLTVQQSRASKLRRRAGGH